jgi:L-lactate dehydrogenase complex protein LldG
MNPRDAFLTRVRQAVVQGNRVGAIPGLPERGSVGYQGAGVDPVARFCQELRGAGGRPYVAADKEAAWQVVRGVIAAKGARRILVGRGGLLAQLDLAARLRHEGLAVTTTDSLTCAEGEARNSAGRDAFFAADLGISTVEHLVAETGSVVVATGPDEPRSLSLLPPVHIAVAERKQLVADLFDLFDLFSPVGCSGKHPPACVTLITGPSKTGDIELRLVTGVHGPGEVHVIICDW